MSYAKRKERFVGQNCALLRRCGGCGKPQAFVCSGKFRVNANGRRLDVWLIYRCQKCGHTFNLPIYERTAPEKLPEDLYRRFLENDRDLAEEYARDKGFLKSKGCRLAK